MIHPALLTAAAAALVAGGGVIALLWRRRARRRALDEMRSLWGRVPAKRVGPAVARRLAELDPSADSEESPRVDDRSWSDLDLDQLFTALDRCVSAVGSQVLHQLLLHPLQGPRSIEDRRRVIDELVGDASLRDTVQLALGRLRHRELPQVVELLWGELPSAPRLARLAPVLSLAAVTTIVLASLGFVPWALLVPLFLVNSALHFVHKRAIDVQPLAGLGTLLATTAELVADDDPRLRSILAAAVAPLRANGRLRRRLAPFAAEDGFGLVQYVKILFLVDAIAYAAVARLLVRNVVQLRAVFTAVGEVDALLAVASFVSSRSDICTPAFCDQRERWAVTAIHHPLLPEPVANDFELGAGPALITGSNMSGKTTFLKTLGVNAVLAQTFGIALAEAYTMPPVEVLTSIGRADNLIEGRSYYMAEVESVLRLVRATESGAIHLLLADELFRGTNPEERIAAASEVLRHLADSRHLVLAATHDLELVELLGDTYRSFHFSDSIDERGLRFDYRIRPGPCTTRNAIALLERVGYPDELVRRARAAAADGRQPVQTGRATEDS